MRGIICGLLFLVRVAADSCPARGCPSEPGAALLQVGATGRTKREATDEQLIEYAKMKTKLAESKDSADIMKSIDMALDGSASSSTADDAQVDNILADASEDESFADAEGDDEVAEDESDADATGEEDADQEKEEDGEDDGSSSGDEESAKQLSLLSVLDVKEADSVALNEDGYMTLAASRNNRKMERFVERIISKLNLEVVDEGGLKGMVPYYSGVKAKQSFEALRIELQTSARKPDSWVARRTSSWLSQTNNVKKAKKTKSTAATTAKKSATPKASSSDASTGVSHSALAALKKNK